MGDTLIYNRAIVKLLLATTNAGKLKELERMVAIDGIEPVGLASLPAVEPARENGESFSENALIKARHYYISHKLPAVADDSGLEVDALGGAPGIYSARYAGERATDSQHIQELLRRMQYLPPDLRGGRFVCSAAVVWSGGERVFTGEVTGNILIEPRGAGGFGYDPIFYYPPLGRTFAEMTQEEKERVSHRGRAFRLFADWLREILMAGMFA